MKKLFVLILIIAALVGLFYLSKNKTTSSSSNTPIKTVSKPDMANLSFASEDGLISLKNGKGERAVEGSDAKDEFTLAEMIKTTGDLNGDGKTDAAGFIVQNSAGTGVFVYMAAAVSGPVSYKGTNAVFIGDRVEPTDISISNSTITVKYLDRKPDEPLSADPSITVTRTFSYKNGELIEK